uniref:Uncharacterized protein n=1 Tax=Kalanchoe fedtschenkoi TaxID=63787 RepID=A0A7N0VD30_KALFE
MLKIQSLRFRFRTTSALNWGFMDSLRLQLPYTHPFSTLQGSGSNVTSGSSPCIRMGGSKAFYCTFRNAFPLKGCFTFYERRHVGALTNSKGSVFALHPHSISDLGISLKDCRDSNKANGHEVSHPGNPTGFPYLPKSDKAVVAIDVDEVLGNFVSALNNFIADRYSLNHSVSEYHFSQASTLGSQ